MSAPKRRRGARAIGCLAIVAAVGTLALYLLGLLMVGLTVSETWSGAGSTPMYECRRAADKPQDAHVLDHQVRYVPLQIMCRTTDGRLFSSSVIPSWFNPAVATFLVVTVALAATGGTRAKRHKANTPENTGS